MIERTNVNSDFVADILDQAVKVAGVTAGSENDAGCVGVTHPLLRWKLESVRAGVQQVAYQIEVARDQAFRQVVSRSDVEPAAHPAADQWPGDPLTSRDVRWVRVRVWTDQGITAWSEPLRIEAALLSPSDWAARPISPLSNCDQRDPAPVPIVRKAFRVDKPVARARLYVSALGIQESFLNGMPLSDAKLEAGWTAYQERILYSVYDATPHLREGENVLAGAVGDGWWRGWLTWMERRAVYGATTAYLAQLEIHYEDGSIETIASDESWRGSTGALRSADLYDGVLCDLRSEQAGWLSPGFDDASWETVRALPLPTGLELRAMPPVRIVQSWSVAPRLVRPGVWAIDAGQNLAGYLRIRASGAPGETVTIRHAEMLEPGGALHTAALRNAKATDTFILADRGAVLLEPAFTFHGFRYAEIAGSESLRIDHVEVCALSTDMPQIGAFACSDERINQLYENVRWSQIGNFVGLPTDCPQRDERLGWTGDIQVFCDTACMNADAAPLLASWLRDLAIEQREDGNVPSTAPNVIQGHEFEYGGVGWGDAATLVPWSLYSATGNAQILRDQFDSMRAWVDYCASRLNDKGVWTSDFQLGDWLDPGAPSDQPEKATTDSHFIASAYLSRSAAVLADTAERIGRAELAEQYRALAREVARATWACWHEHLVTTQAGCALALQFGIVPPDRVAKVGEALADLVDKNEGRIATGFLGTPAVLPALTSVGKLEAAYRLLLNEQCPGWLYQVKRGATTMWERWDAVQEDGSLHAGAMSSGEGSSMISFNHYAYGAVALWLYHTVAGIAPDTQTPGYGVVRFAPKPGGGIHWARGAIDTPFGLSSISWSIGSKNQLLADLTVAPGASGVFEVPEGWVHDRANVVHLASGRHKFCLSRAQ